MQPGFRLGDCEIRPFQGEVTGPQGVHHVRHFGSVVASRVVVGAGREFGCRYQSDKRNLD